MNNKVIGKRIKELRLQKKLTQEELANRLDLTEKYISNIETGTASCGFPKMVQLANILNCSLDYLLGENLKYNGRKEKNNAGLAELTYKLESLNKNQVEHINDVVNSLITHNIK
jgi:transcriptional regulator with XRE-family HTH domain